MNKVGRKKGCVPTKYWIGKKRSEETKKKISDAGRKRRHSTETKMKMSESHLREKSHWWKGGITALDRLIRGSYNYRQWRSDVFTRDGFICLECGKSGVLLEAHHLKPFCNILSKYNIKSLREAKDCSELWNINNGITLCHECHKITDSYSEKEDKK
jgi:hypothetical protein